MGSKAPTPPPTPEELAAMGGKPSTPPPPPPPKYDFTTTRDDQRAFAERVQKGRKMSDRERDHCGAKYGQLTDAESERIKEEMKQAEAERSEERAERCETCRYVHDCGDEWLCRRFPIYATKEFNDWCGEWDPKEEPDHREPIEEMFSDNQVAKLLDASKAEAESIMQKMPHKLLPNGRLYVEKWTFRLWLSCQKGLPVQLQHIADLD